MADLTVASFEEMEPIYDGIARRARATLGVSAFGMQVMTLPADWAGYPNHRHVAGVEDANQEEIYIPLEGSATLVATNNRSGCDPEWSFGWALSNRRIVPGPDGVRLVALGGVPGSFSASPWTELGGPWPVPAS